MSLENLDLCGYCLFNSLILLIISNGTPVIARNLLGSRFAQPIDLGYRFIDQRPLFGSSKTWRGLISSLLITMITAPFLGISMLYGGVFSLLVLTGDLLASFTKRRLGLKESSRCRLLDTIPESILPVTVLHDILGLTLLDGILTVVLFFLFDAIISPLLYRLHIRKRPY